MSNSILNFEELLKTVESTKNIKPSTNFETDFRLKKVNVKDSYKIQLEASDKAISETLGGYVGLSEEKNALEHTTGDNLRVIIANGKTVKEHVSSTQDSYYLLKDRKCVVVYMLNKEGKSNLLQTNKNAEFFDNSKLQKETNPQAVKNTQYNILDDIIKFNKEIFLTHIDLPELNHLEEIEYIKDNINSVDFNLVWLSSDHFNKDILDVYKKVSDKCILEHKYQSDKITDVTSIKCINREVSFEEMFKVVVENVSFKNGGVYNKSADNVLIEDENTHTLKNEDNIVSNYGNTEGVTQLPTETNE